MKENNQPQLTPASSGAPLPSTSSDASSVIETPSTAPASVNSHSDFADHLSSPSPTLTDGWGEIENGIHEEHDSDKGGWNNIEPFEEPKPAPALASIHAAQKRPVSHPLPQSKPHTAIARLTSTLKAAKDEDDDLWGSIAVPLNVKSTAAAEDDDPLAAIAAPPPATRAKPLSAGKGRGAKPADMKLGARRINRTSSGV